MSDDRSARGNRSLTARVVAGSQGRDRVLDAVKAVALLLVVVGHSLAWHVGPDGRASNVLELAPGLTVLTWLFQVLPLFFAAGAVSNAASVRRHGTNAYLRMRTTRLVTPVLAYAAVWTGLLLPAAPVVPLAHQAGVFLAQLLWFAGVYSVVAAAAPLTSRWVGHPTLVLSAWFAAVVAIDVLRVAGAPQAIGWLNLLLVWGWLHQLGYHLPVLRQRPKPLLVAGGLAACAAAVALAAAGPFSGSLVTVGNDTELSNLAPPSVVLVLVGLGQILLLAAAWDGLAHVLRRDRLWAVVALVGARGMGMYLWHIPLVAVAAGLALAASWSAPPLSLAWWGVHLLVVALVVPGAWLLAGAAEVLERRLERLPRVVRMPAALAAFGGGVVILDVSVTGFATWRGPGMLGTPSSTLPLMVLLWLCWQSSLTRPARSAP